MHTCYKIYGYFKFQLFAYHLFSVAHNATVIKVEICLRSCFIRCVFEAFMQMCDILFGNRKYLHIKFVYLFQAYLIYYPLKRRKSLACATLGSLCICQLYLWEHRSIFGLVFHITVACYGTFVIMTRQVRNKLPQYTL